MRKLVAIGTFVGLALGESLLVGTLAQEGAAVSSYVLKVDAPPAKKGQKAVAKIKITPGGGYHLNKEYPTSLAFTTVPAGVSVDKMKLTAKDAAKWEEQGGEFDVAYTAQNAGKQKVTGEIKFAVCSATTCDPKKSVLTFEIDIK
jgi:hypothetical protein